jgi:hypothetical protein
MNEETKGKESSSLCCLESCLLLVSIHAHQLGRVEVVQLLQVEALHARRRAHGLTSAELVRHEACNPDYPDAGAKKRHPAAFRLTSLTPRAQVEVKARVAACEQRRSSLRRP